MDGPLIVGNNGIKERPENFTSHCQFHPHTNQWQGPVHRRMQSQQNKI